MGFLGRTLARTGVVPAYVPVLRNCSDESARRLRKNFSTSRESVSAVAVSSLDAVRTDAAAVLVVPMASLSEPILTTSVPHWQ